MKKTLEISFDEIEKEREKYLLVDTRDKVTVEYGMIPGAISVPEQELERTGRRTGKGIKSRFFTVPEDFSARKGQGCSGKREFPHGV